MTTYMSKLWIKTGIHCVLVSIIICGFIASYYDGPSHCKTSFVSDCGARDAAESVGIKHNYSICYTVSPRVNVCPPGYNRRMTDVIFMMDRYTGLFLCVCSFHVYTVIIIIISVKLYCITMR